MQAPISNYNALVDDLNKKFSFASVVSLAPDPASKDLLKNAFAQRNPSDYARLLRRLRTFVPATEPGIARLGELYGKRVFKAYSIEEHGEEWVYYGKVLSFVFAPQLLVIILFRLGSRLELDALPADEVELLDPQDDPAFDAGRILTTKKDTWTYQRALAAPRGTKLAARLFKEPPHLYLPVKISANGKMTRGDTSSPFTEAAAKEFGARFAAPANQASSPDLPDARAPADVPMHNAFTYWWRWTEKTKDKIDKAWKEVDPTNAPTRPEHKLLKTIFDKCAPKLKSAKDTDLKVGQVVARLRVSLRGARHVFPQSFVSEISSPGTAKEDDDDDDAEHGDELDVGLPPRTFLPWSKCSKTMGPEATRMLESSLVAGTASWTPDMSFKLYEPGAYERWVGATFSEAAWKPPSDGLYRVLHTGLLVRAQLTSLYSHIGTRAHLRLAVASLQRPGPTITHDNAWVQLNAYDPDIFFFAPAESAKNITKKTETCAYGMLNNRLYMREEAFKFASATSDEEELGYKAYTEVAGDAGRLEKIMTTLVRGAAKIPAATALKGHMLAVEVPVLHPFAMFGKVGKRALFHQTQLDFVYHVSPSRASDPFGRKGWLAVGEFKTLMETNNPRARVTSPDARTQAAHNAVLFELMTNVRVSYCVVLHLSRQGAKVHACIFPLAPLRAAVLGRLLGDVQKEAGGQAFVFRGTDMDLEVVQKPKKNDPPDGAAQTRLDTVEELLARTESDPPLVRRAGRPVVDLTADDDNAPLRPEEEAPRRRTRAAAASRHLRPEEEAPRRVTRAAASQNPRAVAHAVETPASSSARVFTRAATARAALEAPVAQRTRSRAAPGPRVGRQLRL